MPVILAVGGGTGLGALINALVNAKGSAFTQLQTFTQTLQAERAADLARHNEERLSDREATAVLKTHHEALEQRVNGMEGQLILFRRWSDALLSWGRAGAEPPEPLIPEGLQLYNY